MKRLLIVDDEALARSRLRALLADVAPRLAPDGAAAGAFDVIEAGSAEEALQQLACHEVDAVLLDIRMPGLDGLGLAAQLRARAGRLLPLIFVSAHSDHALQAFEVAAVDYLTKPVRRDRLVEALRRIAPAPPALPAEAPGPADDVAAAGSDAMAAQVVVAHDRGRVVRIPAQDILYLKAELKYLTVRTADATWLVDASLAELEQRLGRRFLRIHRNALVAVAAIRSLMPGSEAPSSDDGPAAGQVPDRAGTGSGAGGDAWVVQIWPTGELLGVSRRQAPAVRAIVARGAWPA